MDLLHHFGVDLLDYDRGKLSMRRLFLLLDRLRTLDGSLVAAHLRGVEGVDMTIAEARLSDLTELIQAQIRMMHASGGFKGKPPKFQEMPRPKQRAKSDSGAVRNGKPEADAAADALLDSLAPPTSRRRSDTPRSPVGAS